MDQTDPNVGTDVDATQRALADIRRKQSELVTELKKIVDRTTIGVSEAAPIRRMVGELSQVTTRMSNQAGRLPRSS